MKGLDTTQSKKPPKPFASSAEPTSSFLVYDNIYCSYMYGLKTVFIHALLHTCLLIKVYFLAIIASIYQKQTLAMTYNDLLNKAMKFQI